MKKIIKINGMHCLQCKMKIEDTLNAIAGVEAELDLEREIATVKMEKFVTDEQVLTAISEAGYTGIIL